MKYEEDISELEKRLKQLSTVASEIKNDISYEQLKLRRLSDLITLYMKLVEGNNTDNLVRAQL